jgi:hypothetical protein
MNFNSLCITISFAPSPKIPQKMQKAQDIANVPVPVLPILHANPSDFNPGMESQLNKSRETIRRYDAAADQAIQIIRPFLSPRLQNVCSPVLNDPVRNSRTKLLTLWTWLQAKRINDAQIISEIRKDMSLLPEITTFDEAVTSLTLLNQLQAELVTLAQPLSDLELIIIHSNKNSEHDRFVPLKLKYLQRTTIQNSDLPPSFTSGPLPPSLAQTVTWADYCAEVDQHARVFSNSTRTSTVLSAVATSPPIQASAATFQHNRSRGYAYKRSPTRPDQQRSPSDHTRNNFSRRSQSPSRDYHNKRSRSPGPPRDRDRSPGPSRGDQDSWQAFKIARQKALKEADEEVRKLFPEPRRSPQDDRPSKLKTYATSTNPTSEDEVESVPNSITEAEFFALRAARSEEVV